jgi:NAD(P)-dependent dehydrogenase (short-subunit alcohol dehydrogenase family)
VTEAPVVVVTGAGSGLGHGLVRSLAAQGWRLVLVGRRRERLLDTRQACCRAGGRAADAVVVDVDVTETLAAEHVVAAALAAFGRIDALVNNAGMARVGPIENGDVADFDEMLRTNLLAPAALIKAAVPVLRRTGGTIVNVGSIGGAVAVPGRAMYGASKAALHHLTRSLARELAPDVRVNAVVPGPLDTEMYDHLGLPPTKVAALRSELLATTPLGRMGTAEDVVPWIELLLGPAGRWMTGSLVVVDGGRSC